MRSVIRIGVFTLLALALASCVKQEEEMPARAVVPTRRPRLDGGFRIGETAQEIEGEDLHGQRFKLSDFRGKVVVLDFFGFWCGPCVAWIPHERELVQRWANKPFVFLGVDTDRNRGEASKHAFQTGVNWRSWWDGPDGPIVNAWRIDGFPTFCIIDHRGVIRYKTHDLNKDTEELIEQLIRDAGS